MRSVASSLCQLEYCRTEILHHGSIRLIEERENEREGRKAGEDAASGGKGVGVEWGPVRCLSGDEVTTTRVDAADGSISGAVALALALAER